MTISSCLDPDNFHGRQPEMERSRIGGGTNLFKRISRLDAISCSIPMLWMRKEKPSTNITGITAKATAFCQCQFSDHHQSHHWQDPGVD
ncbi:MAG: hypothetical protein IPJ06_20140 [Saprospiraceae bacterium]|nr:hypothetical protein [Saprospiraceae bacterium]